MARTQGAHRRATRTRSASAVLKRFVNVAMFAILLVQMLQQYVPSEVHEVAGMAFAVLFLVHMVQQRRWFAGLVRGKWTVLRALQTLVNAACLAYGVALLGSGLYMSPVIDDLLGIQSGFATARSVHLMATYGGLVACSVHLGMHARAMVGFMRKCFAPQGLPGAGRWVVRVAVAIVAVYGAYSFMRMGLFGFISGAVPYAFFDTDRPVLLSLLDFASICVLFGVAGYAIARGAALAGRTRKGGVVRVPRGRRAQMRNVR